MGGANTSASKQTFQALLTFPWQACSFAHPVVPRTRKGSVNTDLRVPRPAAPRVLRTGQSEAPKEAESPLGLSSLPVTERLMAGENSGLLPHFL